MKTSIEIKNESVISSGAEAIVNAANSSLAGGGGVDGAIHRAAGNELQLYCRRYLHKCKTGDAKISPAFNIKTSEYIIHTVGPVYKGYKPEEAAALLASCYRRSLDLAKDLRSVAFSGISTGIYGYPLDEAAEIAFTTIVDWLEQNPDTNLGWIILCAFTSPEYDAMKKSIGNYGIERNAQKDLSIYEKPYREWHSEESSDDSSPMLSVGWLSKYEGFPKGEVPKEVLDKLTLEADKYTNLVRGYFYCKFCGADDDEAIARDAHPQQFSSEVLAEPISLGMSEIHVPGDGVIYVAPSMILHYIKKHSYLPPKEFLDAASRMLKS